MRQEIFPFQPIFLTHGYQEWLEYCIRHIHSGVDIWMRKNVITMPVWVHMPGLQSMVNNIESRVLGQTKKRQRGKWIGREGAFPTVIRVPHK